jgi:hypothetical protein
LVEDFGTRTVFMIAAILPVLDVLAAFAISDHKISFAQINDELLKQLPQSLQGNQSRCNWLNQQLAAALGQGKQGDRPNSLPTGATKRSPASQTTMASDQQ